MKQLSAAAVERAMKLQDVMLRAMAKRITWFQAAETWALVAADAAFQSLLVPMSWVVIKPLFSKPRQAPS